MTQKRSKVDIWFTIIISSIFIVAGIVLCMRNNIKWGVWSICMALIYMTHFIERRWLRIIVFIFLSVVGLIALGVIPCRKLCLT